MMDRQSNLLTKSLVIFQVKHYVMSLAHIQSGCLAEKYKEKYPRRRGNQADVNIFTLYIKSDSSSIPVKLVITLYAYP